MKSSSTSLYFFEGKVIDNLATVQGSLESTLVKVKNIKADLSRAQKEVQVKIFACINGLLMGCAEFFALSLCIGAL